jgi:hypothetical protein
MKCKSIIIIILNFFLKKNQSAIVIALDARVQLLALDVVALIRHKEIQHKHVSANLQHGIMQELAQA